MCYLINVLYQLAFKCSRPAALVVVWAVSTAFVIAALVHVGGILQVGTSKALSSPYLVLILPLSSPYLALSSPYLVHI